MPLFLAVFCVQITRFLFDNHTPPRDELFFLVSKRELCTVTLVHIHASLLTGSRTHVGDAVAHDAVPSSPPLSPPRRQTNTVRMSMFVINKRFHTPSLTVCKDISREQRHASVCVLAHIIRRIFHGLVGSSLVRIIKSTVFQA